MDLVRLLLIRCRFKLLHHLLEEGRILGFNFVSHLELGVGELFYFIHDVLFLSVRVVAFTLLLKLTHQS